MKKKGNSFIKRKPLIRSELDLCFPKIVKNLTGTLQTRRHFNGCHVTRQILNLGKRRITEKENYTSFPPRDEGSEDSCGQEM